MFATLHGCYALWQALGHFLLRNLYSESQIHKEIKVKHDSWGGRGRERATDTRTEAADIHEKHLTSGLKPFVKAFMRLRVVPSSTPLQLRSTLNKAWVAHEFGISWTEK